MNKSDLRISYLSDNSETMFKDVEWAVDLNMLCIVEDDEYLCIPLSSLNYYRHNITEVDS